MQPSENEDKWEKKRAYILPCDKINQDAFHDVIVKKLDEKTKKEIFPIVCIFKLKCRECGDETPMLGYNDGVAAYAKSAKRTTKELLLMTMPQFLEEMNK